MSDFNVCPRCGAHLDPGEACDCGKGVTLSEEELKILKEKGGIDL